MNHRNSLALLDHLVQVVEITSDIRNAEDPTGSSIDDRRHGIVGFDGCGCWGRGRLGVRT